MRALPLLLAMVMSSVADAQRPAGTTAGAANPAPGSAPAMAAIAPVGAPMRLLIHVTQGPEAPTRAALAFSVARAALEDGHTVALFLAGDAVQLLRDGVLNALVGLGTGPLREHYDAIVAKGGRFYLSAGSSKARGVTEADLQGKPAEFAGPPQLVRLALSYDRTLTY
ncbi:MAG: DsrE family protein [Gemmatimonadaceae bacterium]